MKPFERRIAVLLASLICMLGDSKLVAQIPEYAFGQHCCATESCPACPAYGFSVLLRPLYLQPNSTNLCYAAEADPLPLPTPNWHIHDIRPDYHFGFEVGLGLSSIDSQLSMNWKHFDCKDSASHQVASENMIGPFFEIGPDATPYKRAKGHARFRYDSIYLDYGVLVELGCRLQTNLFVGVNAARIKQTLFSRFSDLHDTVIRTIEIPSSFTGIGPQIGLDFSYFLCRGLHLNGGAAASFLVGTQTNHTDYSAISPALALVNVVPPNKQSTRSRSRTQVVPALEGRLGLAYSYAFCNSVCVNIEAGYEVSLYINAIQSVDIGSEVLTPPVTPDTIGVYARTFHRTLSNFALSGPYLAVNVAF